MRPARGPRSSRLVVALLLAALAVGPRPAAAGTRPWNGLSLSAAFDRLRAEGLEIVYSTRLVKPEMTVAAEPAAATAEGRLRELLAPHGLVARWQAAGWWVVVAARPAALTGRVVRAGDAEPVAGATVTIEESGLSALSDVSGRFALPSAGPGPHTLRVTADGFARLTLRPADGDPLIVVLTPIAVARDEIFVTTPDRRLLDVTARVLHSEPIEGLEERHFVARVAGRRQRVVGAELLAPEARAPDSGAGGDGSPSSGTQLILLLFDRGLGSAAHLEHAKRLALEMLSPGPGGRELVAIASLADRAGPWLESSFTSDRSFARNVVSGLRLGEWRAPGGDPLGITQQKVPTASRSEQGAQPAFGPTLRAGTPGGSAGHRAIEGSDTGLFVYRGQLNGLRQRGRLLSRLDRIILLAEELAGVAGRKHLLFFSDDTDERAALGIEAQGVIESDDIWRLDAEARFPSSAYLARHRRLADALRAADASFTLVELGNALDSSSMPGIRGLAQVADVTGGLTLERPRALRPALDRLLARPTSRYRLTLELDRRASSEIWKEGLDLRLRKAPAGARVFLASASDAGTRTPFGSRLALSGLVLSGEDGGDFGSSIHAVPLGAGVNGGSVWVTMELTGLASSLTDGEATLPVDIYLYAFAPDGEIEDYLAQHLELTVDRVRASRVAHRLRLLGHLDLAPGERLLRMVALAGRRAERSLASYALSVPAAGEEALLLGPLLAGEGGDVPTLLAANTSLPDTPCLWPILDRAAFSAATARWVRSADSRVLLVGRDLPSRSRVLARLQPADDARSAEGFPLEAVASCPEQGLTLLAGELPATARAGRYRLALSVETADGGRTLARTAALEILDRAGDRSSELP